MEKPFVRLEYPERITALGVFNKSPVIAVNDLTARYGDHTILDGVSFQVLKGEIFAIMGGSGCGKSTLLKHMIGLYTPIKGTVMIHGVDIAGADEATLKHVRREMGVLFQSSGLLGSMNLAENVALPLLEHTDLSAATIARIVNMKLGMVNLSGYGHYLPSELSGGMKKRAGLARAMALDPTILFFDEPWAGLDPITSAELNNIIKGINAGIGTTMVIVTHKVESIVYLADQAIMLDRDERGIIAQGDPRELKKHSSDPRVATFLTSDTAELNKEDT